MKKLILSCLVGAAALSAAAAETTVSYTYACDEFRTWGRFKSELYDVAIHLTDPSLVGKKITAIRGVLNAVDGIESTSIWLSKELTLETIDGVKVTVPDTYSKDASVEKITLPGEEGTFGQLSAVLDTPYEITSDGIYVGYSLSVPVVANGQELTFEQKQPIMVSPSLNSESIYVRASKDFMKWTSLNDMLNAGAAIYVTLEGDFEEHCISINSLSKPNSAVDQDFAVKATVSNTGAVPVSKIGYSYTIEGVEYDNTIELETPLEANFEHTAVLTFPIGAISENGEYGIDLNITSINGEKNTGKRPQATTKVTVVPFLPVHRPMLEEFTGTWCGWCPRGMYALECLNELYGDDVVLAAYHLGDPMAVSGGTPVAVSGAPSSILNRGGLVDPFYGKSERKTFGMKDMVEESMGTLTIAAIDVAADWNDQDKTSIAVKTDVRFIKDVENANYKIGYLLINNGLTGTGSDWVQSNTYGSSSSAYVGTELAELTTWPKAIVGMIFNDVVVDNTAMNGVEESLPASIAFNTPYESNYTIDISGNEKIQDKDKLYVAAFILNPDGTILNAGKGKVGGSNAVEAVEGFQTEVSAEYYNLSGIRVADPNNGIFIKVSKMSDGSIRTSKVAR